MSNLSLFEFLIVAVIVAFQSYMALATHRQILLLSDIIPKPDFFQLKSYFIPVEELKLKGPAEILSTLSLYHKNEVVLAEDEEAPILAEVNLVDAHRQKNPIFSQIILSINVYLLRNKGAAADFNLIKDITDRNLDIEEEDITHTLTVPLYLGLMGTMVGIFFGLLNLFFISDQQLDFGINAFLSGVAIAMFASFWGLLCTVVNSSFTLKKSKRNLEKAKHKFYTFLQTELLPVLNQSVSSSVYTLNTNLVKFNDGFSVNLDKLTGLLHKNHDALIAQEKILQVLEGIDITAFAKANIMVLTELKGSIVKLSEFNKYLNALNYLTNGTARLSSSFEGLLNKSNNFYGLAEKLDTRIEESNKLVQFLNNHYQQLEERGEIIRDSVVKVEDIMVKSLKQLEEHTQIKIDAIKQITIKEEDLMKQAFAQNGGNLSKLSLLENLSSSMLAVENGLKANLGGISASALKNSENIESIATQLKLLNEKYDNSGVSGAIKKSINWLTTRR